MRSFLSLHFSHFCRPPTVGVPRRAPPQAAPRRRRFGEADLTSGDAGGSNSRFGGMAARASHWGAGDAAGLYLALGDEAEVPVPLVGSDALVAPRPATARSVTRQRAVGCFVSNTIIAK